MFRKIAIDGFRGIDGFSMEDFRRVNVMVGRNGAGKTSILEATAGHLFRPVHMENEMTDFKALSLCILIAVSNPSETCLGDEKWSMERLAAMLARPVAGREGDRALLLPGESTKDDLLVGIYLYAEEELAELALTEEKIEEGLLQLVEHDPRFRVRYRALYLLSVRNPAAAFSIVRAWRKSDEPFERMAGWKLSRMFFAGEKLTDPELQQEVLGVYANEKDEEIREKIQLYFGDIKASFAVSALIKTISVEDCHDRYALRALREIGDARAVPGIIGCSMWEFHSGLCALALGEIGTPEAVAYLIDHINEDDAVQALGICGGPEALKAVALYLARICAGRKEHDAWRIAEARIALVRLASPNPVNDLLEIATDLTEPDDVRLQAGVVLNDYSATDNVDHVFAVYKNTEDEAVKLNCIRLLSDSPQEKITAAMIRHALDMPMPHRSKYAMVTESELHEVLNKRLKTRYLRMEDLKEYLRAHFKE